MGQVHCDVPFAARTTEMLSRTLYAEIRNAIYLDFPETRSSFDSQIEQERCEYLRENEVKALCLRAREILVDEGNVQRVDAPVTVRVVGRCLFCHARAPWESSGSPVIFFPSSFLKKVKFFFQQCVSQPTCFNAAIHHTTTYNFRRSLKLISPPPDMRRQF